MREPPPVARQLTPSAQEERPGRAFLTTIARIARPEPLDAPALRARVPVAVPSPALASRSPLRERLGNAAPLVASLLLASSIFWAPLGAATAGLLAVGLTIFFVYWVLRSYAVVVAVWIGLRRIRAWQRVDWPARFEAWRHGRAGAEPWDWPRHLVIIPNYKEREDSLGRTLDSLAAQPNAAQLVVVMAMEAREAHADAKALRLVDHYHARFGGMFATFHPVGLPGDTPGKGSNEAWAAREAFSRLIEDGGDDIYRYTITSCDADAVFDPHHFEALNHLFLTAPDRYRTFWQPTIFNSNNIWDVPAPLRIPDGLSGINRTANLVLPLSVKFPTSCYSLSWEMLHSVDYWDEEIIPEDWHLYLKCCFSLGDRVNVVPLYLPLGNDCVLADGYQQTLAAHYQQAKRHAWGASDIPYAWRATTGRTPLSRARGMLLAGALSKVHIFWVAQWYLVTLGILVPAKLAALGAPMPAWWTHKAFHVPGPGWHLENASNVTGWLQLGKHGVVEPTMWLNLVGLLVALCLVPLIALIVLEGRTRPPRPAHVHRWHLAAQYAMWPAMAAITFVWASLPALHAQWRLATGRGLVYLVAEKGRRTGPAALALHAVEGLAPPAASLEPDRR